MVGRTVRVAVPVAVADAEDVAVGVRDGVMVCCVAWRRPFDRPIP